MRARRSRLVPALAMLTAAGVGGSLAAAPATAEPDRATVIEKRVPPKPAKRDVMVVGNNWEGTATIVDARTRKRLATINIVPDKDEEIAEIQQNPDRLAFYLAIQQAVGEGNDQYVDDAFTTRNGKFLAVSRPSFGDVVWIDLEKAVAAGRKGDPRSIVVERQMDGYRTDHMGVSPDRRRLVVSDSTERQVIEFSMLSKNLGKRLRTFESGDTPHENNYSENGKRIFHASIGRVYTPGDEGDFDPIGDTTKGDRWVQVVRNSSFKVKRRWDMGQELAEAGHPRMSSAVRPVAFTPDEKIMYAQVSFFHGLVEFNMAKRDTTGGGDYTAGDRSEPRTGAVTRIVRLPIAEDVKDMPREQYVLDSAHHGLAINESGRKLCVSGTMSDYAAIVDRATFTPKVFKGEARFLEGREYSKPYWAVEGPRNTCWMSMSGSDLVTVISFRKEKVVAEIPVGHHPQRIREGHIRESILSGS